MPKSILLLQPVSFYILIAVLFCVSADHNDEPFAIRISCGALENVETQRTQTLWLKDFGYTGGRTANATRPSYIIPKLDTLRYFPLSDGPENCYYIDGIPVGHYAVRVFFALVLEHDHEGEPLFDVSVDGTQIYSLKPGWSNSDEQSFVEALLFVTKTTISTCFHSTGHGDPSVLSIEVLQVKDYAYFHGPSWGQGTVLRTIRRLNCGAVSMAFDEDFDGNDWGGDRFWLGATSFGHGSDTIISTENEIKPTSDSPNLYPERLYQSAIVSTDRQPDISFQMEVDANRNYSVWLHFAEIDLAITSDEQRVFDVLLNGDVVFKGVDIFQMTGGRYAALVLNKTVFVSGRTLTVELRPSNGSHAIINAIEVFEIIAAESRTSAEEVSALQTLKSALALPPRFGWNGDPCVPQQHPWSGVGCQYNSSSGKWVIDGLGLDNQGLTGLLPGDISKLRHLQSINLSGNSIQGPIPFSLGTVASLQTIDLSYNQLSGSIPESLGQLTTLQILNLNGNSLSGRVPSNIGGRPLHRASFNFTGNAGLCGIPGLPSCGPYLSVSAKLGIAFGSLLVFLLMLVCASCWCKRRQNILRARKIAASREAPYAKARTNFGHNVQMIKHHGVQDQTRKPAESGAHLRS